MTLERSEIGDAKRSRSVIEAASVLALEFEIQIPVVEGCGHVGEGAGGGQRAALSTDRAGARQRIVHMSIAPSLHLLGVGVQPVRAGTRLNSASLASLSSSAA